MPERFPKDCWDKQCPHFHVIDMSIDDLLCSCDLLNASCDACDEDFCFLLCPNSGGYSRPPEENDYEEDDEDEYEEYPRDRVERCF